MIEFFHWPSCLVLCAQSYPFLYVFRACEGIASSVKFHRFLYGYGTNDGFVEEYGHRPQVCDDVIFFPVKAVSVCLFCLFWMNASLRYDGGDMVRSWMFGTGKAKTFALCFFSVRLKEKGSESSNLCLVLYVLGGTSFCRLLFETSLLCVMGFFHVQGLSKGVSS